jgi:hypothetical protein
MNARNVDDLVDCFAEQYRSEQPFHPERGFAGTEKLRRNWTIIFDRVPDFEAELMCVQDSTGMCWSEWRWHGTHFEWRGVILFGVNSDKINWARVYMEPVQVTDDSDENHWITRRMQVRRMHQQQQGR